MTLHRWIFPALAAAMLASPGAHAQTIADEAGGALTPETDRCGRFRTGRAGAVCSEVDTINRMGQHVGPRGFVAEVGAGFAAIVPDGAELRNPASMVHSVAMQRAVALFAANCSA